MDAAQLISNGCSNFDPGELHVDLVGTIIFDAFGFCVTIFIQFTLLLLDIDPVHEQLQPVTIVPGGWSRAVYDRC
jgi:hypothetical protein